MVSIRHQWRQLELELIDDDAGISPDNMKTVDRHHFTHPHT